MICPYLFTQRGLENRPSQQSLANKEEIPSLHNKRVVVVEDEGITLIQLRRILTQAGLQVVGTATNAEEAIQTVLKERPDIVLMDINMPGELNGLDAAEKILATEKVCIIMLTAFSDEEYQQRARQIGTCGYVIKPVNRDVLFPEVEAALERFKAH